MACVAASSSADDAAGPRLYLSHMAGAACAALVICTGVATAEPTERPPAIGIGQFWALREDPAAVQVLQLSEQAMPDGSAVIAGQKSYAIPPAEIIGFDFLLNRFNRHREGPGDYDVTAASIRRNLRHSWVVDNDPFAVNQFLHPFQGSMYHGFARSAGLTYWEALGYTFAGSAMWEGAGENTPPSRNDQIASGIAGTFLGESLFRMANLVLEHRDGLPQALLAARLMVEDRHLLDFTGRKCFVSRVGSSDPNNNDT